MQDNEDTNLDVQRASEPSFYHEEEPDASAQPFLDRKTVSWTASEFIAHQKSLGWYALLTLATAVFSALIYLISQDLLTVIAIVVVGLSFGFFAARQPRTLKYTIDTHGITIGDKLYPYSILRTFSVVAEGALNSITLIPLKRFMPAISIYYPPEQEEEILTTLSVYLPHEERRPDPIDRLMRHIRF